MLFSVCIPTYNRAQYLKDAIKSVLCQSFKDYEIIVYDDNSEDETEKVVKTFNDSRIRYYKGEENRGRPYARNQCIKLAKGKWIVWLDDDDIMMPDLLANYAVNIKSFPSVSVFYLLSLIYLDMKTGERWYWKTEDYYFSNNTCIRKLMRGSVIPNPGVCVRRSIYFKYGFYDEEFLRAQDYEFWFRIVPFVDIKGVDYLGVIYRVHDNNASCSMDFSYESLAKRRFLNFFTIKEIYSSENIELFVSDLINHGDYFNASYYLWLYKKNEVLRELMSKIGKAISQRDRKLILKFRKAFNTGKFDTALGIADKLGLMHKYVSLAYWHGSRNEIEALSRVLRQMLLIDPYIDISSFELDEKLNKELQCERDRILRVANKYEIRKKEFVNTFWKVLNENSSMYYS